MAKGHQKGNQNRYLEGQTTQLPKEKGQKDKQRSRKHIHKTKDRVTRTPLKTGGTLMYQTRVQTKRDRTTLSLPIFMSLDHQQDFNDDHNAYIKTSLSLPKYKHTTCFLIYKTTEIRIISCIHYAR